jgi:L-threonylcarbamoyladenylate synthase
VALALLRAAAIPVAAPSANRSTQLSPTRAEHVLRGLAGQVDLVLDGGAAAGGLESTVLDLTTTPPRLLRPGLVTPAEIEEVIGPIALPAQAPPAAGPLPAPGMLPRHYAPRTLLECVRDDRSRVEQLLGAGLKVGWLALTVGGPVSSANLTRVDMPSTPSAYAASLYATLHALDALGLDRIVVALPPGEEEWVAIHDRLRRASVPGVERHG